MVALWSKEYFGSEWCTAELSQLHLREGHAEPGEMLDLVVPVIIHDGDAFPPAFARIQARGIQRYASPWPAPNTPDEQRLSEELRTLATAVAHAIDRAPNHDPGWERLSIAQFRAEFADVVARQVTVPTLGLPADVDVRALAAAGETTPWPGGTTGWSRPGQGCGSGSAGTGSSSTGASTSARWRRADPMRTSRPRT
jgi:hypothetical protein